MAIGAYLNCKTTTTVVDVQNNAQVETNQESVQCLKGGFQLDYEDLKKKQAVVDTEYSEDDCGEEASPGFVPVMGCTKTMTGTSNVAAPAADNACTELKDLRPFDYEETLLIFDYDDTILPSAWVHSQGLRLDADSQVSESQRQLLDEVANQVIETLLSAKKYGTVVLVTNAERGWIELSCLKFMPTVYPVLENLKLLSARTTYESVAGPSPVDWKVCAFEHEISRIFGSEVVSDLSRRKNILSLGDGMPEREALLRSTATMPNCRSKSMKFEERPDISQILKQHSLITGCFERIVQHDGNLDLCIRCA